MVLMGYRKGDPTPDPYAEAQVREWAHGEPEPLRFYRYPESTAPTIPMGDILFATLCFVQISCPMTIRSV